ncbi:MAG TPA: TSUP family transporter [Bacteroidota bacterium]|nr:TSUP family transporter [Bacteroidota bacterium]
MTLTPLLAALLFAGGAAAGWIDSIAGGGGLITIPLLLWVGLPPQVVLGTNKFQSSFGSFTAARHYAREGLVPPGDALPGVLFTLAGATAGCITVQVIPGDVMNGVIPFLLLGIAVYLLFTPSLGHRESHARFSRIPFYALFGLLLGFYDGFFGPGVGSFWAIAFVLGLGFDLRRATGYTKVMNFTSNIVSCGIFLAGGNVLFGAGLLMGCGEIAGAALGSRMVVRRGVRFIRPIFVTMVIATTLKLLYDRFF